ncbi:hypothetical protein MELA_02644 [Candidatus Methylomirabilis lanthanidiphila]|uniref:Uncharacterized protein n=1 Tax=Candidatus Methylomirabilis lanthanidiphila TaxID=2211376 RepID=A0A564ZLQ3_9BACT|nr:hypothetical protein MELA_02644 [Candidatus Methylomirabilis lanthanidiphila]
MGVHQTGKRDLFTLASCGFLEQIGVKGEKHASQAGGAIQQDRIGQTGGVIVLGGKHIDAAESEADNNRTRNVNVGVERKGQYGRS